jgi:thiamine-phosphate pyrophosphorylase
VVRLLVLTDRSQCASTLVATIASAVERGARAVVVREKDLPEPERAALVKELRAILDAAGGLLLVAGKHGPGLSGSAVHLSSVDEFPAPRPALVGRSCHTAAEVARASDEGCDYVTVSPVYPSASKPGYGPALGAAGLAALARDAPPVYALGGVLPDHVPDCVAAGAHGVAAMGPIMRDPDLVSEYLAALEASL